MTTYRTSYRLWMVTGLLALVLLLMSHPILHGLGHYLMVEEDELQPADLIHSLGGNFSRLDYTDRLYRQGYAPTLFITGDSDAAVYRRYLFKKGIPAAAIRPDISHATSTYEEALELNAYLNRHPAVRSVIIVSSPYHMRRARWTFERVLGHRVTLQFAPVPFKAGHVQPQWWRDPVSRHNVVSEWVKLVYYHLRY
ncbi:MAG: YdcF family protein [Anaerolineae bacterium]|nr:YdcF family protein [Anaerolineae bacterium]